MIGDGDMSDSGFIMLTVSKLKLIQHPQMNTSELAQLILSTFYSIQTNQLFSIFIEYFCQLIDSEINKLNIFLLCDYFNASGFQNSSEPSIDFRRQEKLEENSLTQHSIQQQTLCSTFSFQKASKL